MAGIDEWAAFLSGDYRGWMRPPDGEWEDLIGPIQLVFVPSGGELLNATLTSVEFGTWSGALSFVDMVLKGQAGHRGAYFECAFRARGESEEVQACFLGGVFESPTKQLFEWEFTSNWRKRPPAVPLA